MAAGDQQSPPPDPDEVVVLSGAKSYHRPLEEGSNKPACHSTAASRVDDEGKRWSIAKADAWREKCQRDRCWGNPDYGRGSGPELPTSTEIPGSGD